MTMKCPDCFGFGSTIRIPEKGKCIVKTCETCRGKGEVGK